MHMFEHRINMFEQGTKTEQTKNIIYELTLMFNKKKEKNKHKKKITYKINIINFK